MEQPKLEKTELLKDIKGYEGRYAISSFGPRIFVYFDYCNICYLLI